MLRRITVLLVLALAALGVSQERIRDVIYLKQAGCAFTMDVFKPAKPNGMAVIALVSGGWFSSHDMIDPNLPKVLNDRGITVFEVVHGAQPRYHIDEILVQLRRAIRFIRYNATTYGVKPNALGVFGVSSGGHLSLMLAGTPSKPDPEAKDPIDRVGSELQAVVSVMPPTDFLNWGKSDFLPYDDKQLQIFIPAFGIKPNATADERKEVARALSPITYVNPQFPPTLLLHGGSDKLVPIQQSQLLDAAFTKAGVTHQFITVPGAGHDGSVVAQKAADVIAWFEKNLKK